MSKQTESSIWLGWGKEWGQNEAQLVYDLLKRDLITLIPEENTDKGQGYIHGVLDHETDIRLKESHANGHVLITGASGSGKTRFFDLVMKQLILKNQCLIFVDPKGDRDIRKIAKETCAMMGEPERYMQWHPAFPRESVRLNPLKNFSRPSEVAARVTAVIPQDGDAYFIDLATQVCGYIVEGLILIGEQLTLVNIKYYYQHFGELIEKTCIEWFSQNGYEWEKDLLSKINKTTDESLKAEMCIAYYRKKVAHKHSNAIIESMSDMYINKRRALEQSTGSLIANLEKLTEGELAEMLSPSNSDTLKDTRPAIDLKQVIEMKGCFIIGTDSLANKTVSSALGKMILSDAAAVAADRYNTDDDSDQDIINIIVDEASEVLCEPLIQMVNKARGSKIRLWIATQTISDLTAELGSEAKADQIIASTNNFISFRCADTATQERVCAKTPPTRVRYVMRTQGFNASNDDIDGLGANIGERLMEEEVPVFPQELMGQLPDLEYVASFVGGRLFKGRLPILGVNRG